MTVSTRFIVVGADAAGMSAASEARRVDPDLDIVAYDRGGYASYSQCGLPYLVGNVVSEHQRLIARSVTEFAARGITVHLGHEVIAVDPMRRVLQVRDPQGTETEQGYDRLLLATGASPVPPPIPGLDLAGVFHLDVMEDGLAIRGYIQKYQPRRAVIIGGGYIGLEMAENLQRLGLVVALVQRGAQLFPSVDVGITVPINEELARHGVDVSMCESVVQACGGADGRVAEVQTSQGAIPADLVLVATGVRPSTTLAEAAGIELGANGAIAVDDHQRTSAPDVFAAGDCAEHWHRLLRRPTWVPLGTTANKQGRIAGRNAAGGDEAFAGIVGTAVVRVFDLEVGRTGLTEREAAAAGLSCMVTSLDSTDYAGYLPGARALTIKLVAEQGTGRLLGGQAVGYGGVAKRIDVLATALYADMTVDDLTRLDLAYAPPFNSVWDPIQVAATKLLRQGATV
jgi:NADPH-dependent 2,4-dienoyl-CoA reductase/sulfur reductase-like enzyme